MSEELREIFDHAPPKPLERRQGSDIRQKAAAAVSVPTWVLFVSGLYALSMALPENRTLFDAIYQKTVRTYWDTSFLDTATHLWAAGAAFAAGSCALFWKRTRRKGDRAQLSAYIGLGLSVAAMALLAAFRVWEGL